MIQNLNNLLSKITGLMVVKASIDLRGITDDPIHAYYLANSNSMILNLDVNKGGEFLYSDYKNNSISPYYQAARKVRIIDGIDGQSLKNEISKIFNKYAELVNITDANELIDLEGINNKHQKSESIWKWALPWESVDIDKRAIKRIENIRYENKRYGLNSDLSLIQCGVGHKKIEVETERLLNVALSIIKKGYITDVDDMITVNVYTNDADYVWRVIGGMHRAAILAALGREFIPVKVNTIIRRSDVSGWPGVVSGIYSKDSALKLFDNIFNAQSPSAFKAWQKWLLKYNSI